MRELISLDYETISLENEHARQISRISMILKPILTIDGNQWCALYGESLRDGVVGFGSSPDEAYHEFDKAWYAKLKTKQEG
jgi:hypothetical protein